MAMQFTLKDIPKSLGIVHKYRAIAPVVQQQFANSFFNLGRINVTGDGNCGFYVLQLLHYLTTGQELDLTKLYENRILALENVCTEKKIDETFKKSLQYAKQHYLEYLEVGIYMHEHFPAFNLGIIVQSDVKKTGEKKQRRVYPVRVVKFSPDSDLWVFMLLSRGSRKGSGWHYELITHKEKSAHNACFTIPQAQEFMQLCDVEYPTEKIDPSEQLWALDSQDFLYF